MSDELSTKDYLFLALTALVILLTFGGCQLLDDYHERFKKETEQLYPAKKSCDFQNLTNNK